MYNVGGLFGICANYIYICSISVYKPIIVETH